MFFFTKQCKSVQNASLMWSKYMSHIVQIQISGGPSTSFMWSKCKSQAAQVSGGPNTSPRWSKCKSDTDPYCCLPAQLYAYQIAYCVTPTCKTPSEPIISYSVQSFCQTIHLYKLHHTDHILSSAV